MLATTSGRATSESIVEAAKKERPKTTPSELRLRKPSAVLEKITVPNRARTIEGMPAIASIVDSVIRARPAGRPYSTSQTAMPMPIGRAIEIPIAATIRVPRRASEKPPVSLWVNPAEAGVTSIEGRRYLIPWISR